MKIGFIGLGIMGSRMAGELQKHGYPLVVFNRTRSQSRAFARPLRNIFLFASKTRRASGRPVHNAGASRRRRTSSARSPDGFLDHLKANALWVDCSSVNPSFSKKMAAEAARREVRFVDAPVTGSAPAAAEANSFFWVGADIAELERIAAPCWRMSNKIVHTGGMDGKARRTASPATPMA